jgi:hypothetical protein
MSRPARTPVALFVFNRPEPTRAVFERIAGARPPVLLIVADGPRAERVGEDERCGAARAIVDRVDWPCEVLKDFSPTNLGCRRRMSSGIDWVFGQVPQAVLLEDDCVPEPTFFGFADEMVERFAGNDRVMMVAGNNPLAPWKSSRSSYHFSHCTSIWGWATWRRAWAAYDVDMKAWTDPAARQRMATTLGEELYQRRVPIYDKTHRGLIDTWDFQWNFARFIRGGLTVVPSVNLVSNIGFGAGATHTHKATHPWANQPTAPMEFPLRHPQAVNADREFDRAFTYAAA